MSVTNFQATYASDVENYIQDELLPLVQKDLVMYQFGQMLRLPKHHGLTYAATRYDRVNLPIAPLSEGVPSVGETIPITPVSVTAQQWGDSIEVTDIGDFSIKHPLFQTAKKLLKMQSEETLERNTDNALLANTYINYVNSRGSRNGLLAGDVMNTHEANRMTTALRIIGAYQFNGPREEDVKLTAGKPSKSSNDPAGMPHYVAVTRPEVAGDLRENSTFVLAATYSNINALYNAEVGAYAGMRWIESNMLPYWVGVAAPTSGASATNGSFAAASTGGAMAAGTWYVQIVGMQTLLGYETAVGAASAAITVGGSGSGSISVTLPTTTGYTYLVYCDQNAAPVHLGTCNNGPTVGALAGQAALLAAGTTVVITGQGVARTPPANPGTGITVYPTFVFGQDAFAQVMLDDMKFYYLDKAEKVDPHNQLYVVAWKCMWNTIILNNNFMGRIESVSNFSSAAG